MIAQSVHPESTAPAPDVSTARSAESSPDAVLVFATQGAGHGDETRIIELVSGLKSARFAFDRGGKARSGWQLFRKICRERPPLVVMEGTGIGGGVAVLMGRLIARVPYVVSSGDAVGPYLSARMPLMTPLFALYERMLCQFSAGFIGWTPYLVGRALTFGSPRGVTAPGWCERRQSDGDRFAARDRIRASLGIGPDDIVFGIAGSLDWNPRVGYCYGYELVHAGVRARRRGLRILIVGDGSGRKHLELAAGGELGKSILMTGRVPREKVADYLAAMDIGSLPQSVDGVGSFRYTIKLSEYIAASLPIVTGQIPLAYDLDDGWLWRLAGHAPWDERYLRSLAALMQTIKPQGIADKRSAVPVGSSLFERETQVRRVGEFLHDLMESKERGGHAS